MCFSIYSDMSRLIKASSSPNRNSARVFASSVFPTPEGPRKMNDPPGLFGSFKPARVRRIAWLTAVMASSWPITRLYTGIPVQIESTSAIASSSTSSKRSTPSDLICSINSVRRSSRFFSSSRNEPASSKS